VIKLEYKIKPGDWLSKIAPQYNMTWQELYDYDGGTGKTNRERLNEQKTAKGRPPESIDNPNLIYPDDVILVPDEEKKEESTEEKAPEKEEAREEPAPEAVENSPLDTGSTTWPNYAVTVGSEKFSFDSKNKVVCVKVARGIGLPTDRCEVLLASSDSYNFKKGDNLKVELGYDTNLKLVFSGLVEDIECLLSKVRVTALGPATLLLHLRLNRVYLNQTAGHIVSNLAKEGNVQVQKVSDGITLPMYVVDETTNAYEHILRLAERCNFDAYITENEKLVFKEWGGGKNYPIQYGKGITGVKTLDFSPLYAGARVHGESPSSMKGSDSAHWLAKQEVKGEAGTSSVLSIDDPAIKDKKTAETVAKARKSKLEYTFGVAVETVGNPVIKLGDTVTLKDVPIPNLKGQLEVRSVQHYLSKAKGFTTTINCWRRQ
jgi:phage protein D